MNLMPVPAQHPPGLGHRDAIAETQLEQESVPWFEADVRFQHHVQQAGGVNYIAMVIKNNAAQGGQALLALLPFPLPFRLCSLVMGLAGGKILGKFDLFAAMAPAVGDLP